MSALIFPSAEVSQLDKRLELEAAKDKRIPERLVLPQILCNLLPVEVVERSHLKAEQLESLAPGSIIRSTSERGRKLIDG